MVHDNGGGRISIQWGQAQKLILKITKKKNYITKIYKNNYKCHTKTNNM